MQEHPKEDHWKGHAKQWARIASPLRPNAEDQRIVQQAIASDAGRCLLLGVTPEFSGLSARLIAVDHNAAMIGAVWPGNLPGRQAVQGDWLHLPFGSGTFDAAVGDGCLTLLEYPRQYLALFDQLALVLKPSGRLALRAFVSPDQEETPEAVCREAVTGKIGSFHAYKWRLAMAIAAKSANHNVRVTDILETFDNLVPDRKRLAKSAGWSLEDIATIDVYRASPAAYSFPTLAQIKQAVSRRYKEIAVKYGSYELAERCPVLVLESAE